MSEIIRKIKIEDCPSIARVVTLGWNQTYKGIVNEEFLQLLVENEELRSKRMIGDFETLKDDEEEFLLPKEAVFFECEIVKKGKKTIEI